MGRSICLSVINWVNKDACMLVCLSVCLPVSLSVYRQNAKTRFSQKKTKFRTMVSIDDLSRTWSIWTFQIADDWNPKIQYGGDRHDVIFLPWEVRFG